MPLDLLRIEASLGRDVRRYLQDSNPEATIALSSDLEYLLTGLWEAPSLSKARWFDGLVDATFKVSKPNRVEVHGLMYWGSPGRDGRQWVDVFSADLLSVLDRDEGVGYTLRFGRKGLEDRRIPYGEHRDLLRELEQPGQWEWAFVFNKPREAR